MADENNGSQGSAGTSNEGEGGNTSGDTSQSASGAAGTSNEGADDANKGNEGESTVSRDEFEQLKRRMQAADQRASRAEQELNDRKRAEQTELQNAQQDLETATKRIAELEQQINTTALENAFFKDNKHTWHDPSDALRLMDMEGVEVKDGKVTGLAPAIEKLAKAKPHLLSSESGNGGGKGSSEASGNAANGRRKGEQKPETKDYSSRFPALRNR